MRTGQLMRGRAGQARPLNDGRAINHRRRRAAFATVTAVALIGLTAMAVVAITTELITDARRTRGAEIETQLRQLLIAGADEAGRNLATWDAAEGDGKSNRQIPIPLPGTLATDGSLKLTLTQVSPSAADASQSVEVRVDATWCGRRAAESLRYSKSNGAWSLEEVRRV